MKFFAFSINSRQFFPMSRASLGVLSLKFSALSQDTQCSYQFSYPKVQLLPEIFVNTALYPVVSKPKINIFLSTKSDVVLCK